MSPLSWMGLSLVLLLGSAATPAPAPDTTYQFGPLRVVVESRGTVNAPMEGPTVRMVVTNTGAVAISNLGLQATSDGQNVVFTPQTRRLAVGESATVTCNMASLFGNIPIGVPTTRTVVWNMAGNGTLETPLTVINWMGNNGTVATPGPGQGMTVSVRVQDETGNPLTANVYARGGTATQQFTSSGTAGSYAATLPRATTWAIVAEVQGRRTGYLFLPEARDYADQVITLVPQAVRYSYSPASTIVSGIGPWQGRVNGAEDAILTTSGMEHWSAGVVGAITQSKVRLHAVTGEPRWEFSPGYEAWAADLSADGRWAAVATLDPGNSSSGAAGPLGTLSLLDAATGQAVWQRTLDTTLMNSPAPQGPQPPGGIKPGVREVRFSPDAALLAVGDNLGDLALIRRSDGTRAWSANLGGDVRAMRFSADSATVYAVFASGLTAAFRVSDGVEVWRTETYAWAHAEGFVLSPDGTKLGVMSAYGDVILLNASTGARLWYVDTRYLAWWGSFTPDGTIFVAGTQTGATIGYRVADGTPVFTLSGGKGGSFATGTGFFVLGNWALYDQTGTRLSDFFSGLNSANFGNWQVSWIAPDAKTIWVGQQESQSLTQPVLFRLTGQATTACAYSVTPTSQSVVQAGGDRTLSVTTNGACTWTARPSASWVTVTQTARTGTGSVTYSVAANTGAAARTATIAIGDQTVTVTQAGAISMSPSSLRFVATQAAPGSSLIQFTGSQAVTVLFASSPAAWTVTSNQPWLTVANGSGVGSGTFTASLVAGVPVSTTQATLTLASGGTSVALTVTLVVSTSSSLPIGQVDTPVQNATGVQGAIGVTGWALDDFGVQSVKIYRNCLAFDIQASCQIVLGYNVVEVGDAAFLSGARSDVEAVFTTYPQNNRAGWGFLMLTSMLPQVTTQQSYGGQGPLTIYVVATDVEGNRKLLGRSSDPASPDFAVPTQITMANATIAKPFGAIDTPAQGATVSGALNNFGWALTPDSNITSGESGDILIPTDGSTITVFIDSLPVALVAYNQCRGNVGSPVPTGMFCNDDVSNIFGNATPQAVLTSRTANATLFRNLDAARAPIGVYSFNTATLVNGLHTIAWSVTDSANRTEGIGSRFFNVLNSGADQSARPTAVRGVASAPEVHSPGTDGVWGRTGFALDADWKPMYADASGVHRVRLPELGRLELWLGAPVEAASLVAPDGTLRDLPVGASVSGALFAWAPPAGYLGPYSLAFVRGSDRVEVLVTVVPPPGAPDNVVAQVRMQLDAVRRAQCGVRSKECSVRVEGWAFDPDASIGSGIGYVHVWARSLDQTAGAVEHAPFFLGAADLNVRRPDVAQAFAGAPQAAGFQLDARLAPGAYELTAYVWNERTARWEDARTTTVTVR